MILSTILAATLMMAQSSSTAVPSNLTAAPPAPLSAEQAKKADKDGDHMVCKTEAVTGSMFPKKTCYSAKEMAQRQQDERANLEKIQNASH